MEFRTEVEIQRPDFEIGPCEELLFVGSCFAQEIGSRFRANGFPVTVNPYGTMYNPVSVLHTLERWQGERVPDVVFLTLGTNHVYRLRETGEIVDNCQKRPAALFREEELTVDECAEALSRCVALLRQWNAAVRVVFTVSPIRYRKYGYHGSQLSKATLLLAVEQVVKADGGTGGHTVATATTCQKVYYFPAYEVLMDELRDYRFWAADMLHPSEQAVDYVWERLADTLFAPATHDFLAQWQPLKRVLDHRPLHPDSPDYRALMDKTMLKVAELREKYPNFAL